jgi:hypothetical protein
MDKNLLLAADNIEQEKYRIKKKMGSKAGGQ